MTETGDTSRTEPLVWGTGPRTFEVFLEPTCPYSIKAFGKLDQLLEKAGPENITIKIILHSQPWHLYSGVIIRCVLAASTLAGGKEAAKAVLAAVAAHRDEFEPINHCIGPNMEARPGDVIARIEEYTGLQLADAFILPHLDREIKRHTKYARQNGIHVSPSFMINGLVQTTLSSQDEVSEWISHLMEA
ncbi:hypothetical protein GCM10007276_28490 [Agaricicola taiwanensis]|uniref:Thioredoxin n=1 Tax=Agaricicola taiwanensis TaxID=591372 RepID=A0A8J2YKZ0_9RHOB|nr:thioredoxin domain-containing protein [Agaricicola taiwanensis]GGE49647.1 hypothetical protein GCM10007276_28490 [Agaricicola taiwanensis]